MFAAIDFWRQVRTSYGSFLATTAVVALLMARVGDHVLLGAFCIFLLFSWCLYGLNYLASQVEKGQAVRLRWTLRQMFVVIACLAVIVGAVFNHWLFHWRFAISQPELDQFADRLEGGRQFSKPHAVGLFVIEKAEMRGRRPCLWTDTNLGGNTGFVRCAPEQARSFNLWSTERMNDHWQLIIED